MTHGVICTDRESEASEYGIIEKTWVYPVAQAVWGVDHPRIYYFRTKEARDEYGASHDHLDILPRRKLYILPSFE